MDETKYGSSIGSKEGKAWRDMTPEEVKENVRDKVAKGVAAVAGAIKGFTDEAKQSDLAKSTREAIERAGDTTREIASSAKSEYRRTKDEMKTKKGTTTGHEGMGMGGSSLGGASRLPTSGVPDLGPSGGGYADREPTTGTKEKDWKAGSKTRWPDEP